MEMEKAKRREKPIQRPYPLLPNPKPKFFCWCLSLLSLL